MKHYLNHYIEEIEKKYINIKSLNLFKITSPQSQKSPFDDTFIGRRSGIVLNSPSIERNLLNSTLSFNYGSSSPDSIATTNESQSPLSKNCTPSKDHHSFRNKLHYPYYFSKVLSPKENDLTDFSSPLVSKLQNSKPLTVSSSRDSLSNPSNNQPTDANQSRLSNSISKKVSKCILSKFVREIISPEEAMRIGEVLKNT